MAYATGIATSMADLLTALQNACTANGWTLTGDILWKGNCFAQVKATADYLTVQGGLGKDATPALTTPTPTLRYLQAPINRPMVWPGSYHIFVYANEVYLILKNGVDAFLFLAFGESPLTGLPAGAGVWCGASACFIGVRSAYYRWDRAGGWGDSYGRWINLGALFFPSDNNSTSTAIYSPVTNTWIEGAGVAVGGDLIKIQPNAWNGESTMAPIQPYHVVASAKTSVIAELTYARYIRIDFIEPESIVTLGTEEWMVFPWYRKSVAARDGEGGAWGASGQASGTFGWAIRKNG